ncbi:MAG: hypothetical protein O2816_13690 [Planctomycetota bacterium]|nr:hypothetical protein [Planctomycetota bacterium]
MRSITPLPELRGRDRSRVFVGWLRGVLVVLARQPSVERVLLSGMVVDVVVGWRVIARESVFVLELREVS